MEAKKLGILIAGGMPPPDKLRRAMAKSSSDDGADAPDDGPPEDDETEGGASALKDAFDALKSGDEKGAWDAFCAAIDIAKNRDAGSSSDESDSDKQ